MRSPAEFRKSGRTTLLTLLALTGFTVGTHYKDGFASFNFGFPDYKTPSWFDKEDTLEPRIEKIDPSKNDSWEPNDRGYYLPIRLRNRAETKARIRDGIDDFSAPRRLTGSHRSVDYRAPVGTPVYAVRDNGIVIEAKDYEDRKQNPSGTYKANGKTVKVKYPDRMGITSIDIHLNEIVVKEGDHVDHDTILGYVGITGNASGDNPHLHHVLRIGSKKYDPEKVEF